MARGRDTWRAAGDAAQCGADLVPVDQCPHTQHHHPGAAGGHQLPAWLHHCLSLCQEVHIVNKTEDRVEDLKIPYQIFGESLASLCVLTVRGYKVSTQQVSSLNYVNVKIV